MKATLEFNLPEDTGDYELANRAGEMYSALSEIERLIRSRLKYNSPSTDECAFLENLRAELPDLSRIP